VVETKEKEWLLNANDLCDSGCNAQAYIWAKGLDGDLLFCAHHYEEIMSNAVGYDKMMRFAIEVIDERERLIENRLRIDD
jgi:hypothetical protein